ncbi:MAG: hypothetical protein K0R73_1403 [Candidatus Midichloriaceae bacterium]|jgi:hypothetical protein|nr:hypothetical protein [Candidatus Midichloriaceae bacterium]
MQKINFKQNNTEDSNININIKLDRIMAHVDAKVYGLKTAVLKWIIGTSMLQIIFNFTFNMWGV